MPNEWGKVRLRNLACATEELAKAMYSYADKCGDVECEMVNILVTPFVKNFVLLMAPLVGLKVSGNTKEANETSRNPTV